LKSQSQQNYEKKKKNNQKGKEDKKKIPIYNHTPTSPSTSLRNSEEAFALLVDNLTVEGKKLFLLVHICSHPLTFLLKIKYPKNVGNQLDPQICLFPITILIIFR